MGASVFSVTSAELNAWMVAFLWPFVRMLALVGTAPIFGEPNVPRQLKVAIAALLAIALAPALPAMEGPEDVPLRILLPSFVISELKTAFQIGFTIFIPFLIIDLVVASVLMSMGMMMVPPASIALPFKLMLFVMADGWQLLIGALAQSFFV